MSVNWGGNSETEQYLAALARRNSNIQRQGVVPATHPESYWPVVVGCGLAVIGIVALAMHYGWV
jgi:hypothetical protein